MAKSEKRLRLGVIGLGRSWRQRYRPALLALGELFQIQLVADPVAVRARLEARELDCGHAAGPTEMMESAALDAVVLLDSGWQRFWPLEVAARFSKPVFCATPPRADDRLPGAPAAVMAALPLRVAPAVERLRELLATELGPARIVLCEYRQPVRPDGRRPRGNPAVRGAAWLALIDGCLGLLDSPARGASARVNSRGRFTDVLLDCAGQRTARITRCRVPGASGQLRLEVVARRGQAVIDLPNRVRWESAGGRFAQWLPGAGSSPVSLLRRFHRCVTEGSRFEPNLQQAWWACSCLTACEESLSQGARVPVLCTQHGSSG